MKKYNILLILILVLQNLIVFGQTASVDKELVSYLKSLKQNNIHSYIVLEQGCFECKTEYYPKPFPDDKIIYVLTEVNGDVQIQKLEKNKKHSLKRIASTSIFTKVEEIKNAFIEKDNYLRSEAENLKDLKFTAPHPKHYPYTIVKVNLPAVKNEFTIVDNEYSVTGEYITRKEWFKPINLLIESILEMVKVGNN